MESEKSEGRRHILLWLGMVLVLPFAVPYLLNNTLFRPPPRPAVVPGDAVPFRQGADSLWWWASCRELDTTAYSCRLFDETGGLAVAGRFVAEARNWNDDGAQRAGYCRPGVGRVRFGGYYNGEISTLDGGCVLAPRDWTLFPSRGTKSAVTHGTLGTSLAREVKMTSEELKEYAR